MPDWHASFLDFFFLTSTVTAKNSSILILKWNGKMQWILNSKVAKFCFSLVHNVTLPVACFGCSEALWLSFTDTISFPPSHLHTWPFVSPTHPRVLALLVSSPQNLWSYCHLHIPNYEPSIYPQLSFDGETFSKMFRMLLVLVINYMCTCNRIDSIYCSHKILLFL